MFLNMDIFLQNKVYSYILFSITLALSYYLNFFIKSGARKYEMLEH